MDDKGKTPPTELDGDKTVVIDRNELTELMTAPRGDHRSVSGEELDELVREARRFLEDPMTDPTRFIPQVQTDTPEPPEPPEPPRPPEPKKPEQGEAAKRIIEERAEDERRRKRNRWIIICLSVVAVLAAVLAMMLLHKSSEQRKDYASEFNAAQLEYYDGNYDAALSRLRGVMAIDKTDECLLLMSQCYEAKHDYANAISILESSNSDSEVIKKRIERLHEAQAAFEGSKTVTVCGRELDAEATSADLSNLGLTGEGLEELEKLPKLTSLKLSGNRISSIGFLSRLGGLVSLDLSDNEVRNLGPIRSLTQLRTLHLDNNAGIEDLTPLYELHTLTMLTIGGIELTESRLNDLREHLPGCLIYCDEAEAEVLEFELGGKKIRSDATKLDLSGCSIVDISPLSVCTGLTELHLSGNYIKDLSPLVDIPGLIVLDVSENMLTDISPLMSMTSLSHLNLAGNSISSLVPLRELTSLQELVVNNNPIESVAPLSGLTAMKVLGLKNVGLTDEGLGCLYGLRKLTKLSLNDNPQLTESGVDELKKKLPDCTVTHSELLKLVELGGEKFDPNAEKVTASGLGLSDISAVTQFKQIKELDLSGNIITALDPLAELRTLTVLDLTDNNIEDAAPLYALTGLKELRIGSNNLTPEQIAELTEKLPDCNITVE